MRLLGSSHACGQKIFASGAALLQGDHWNGVCARETPSLERMLMLSENLRNETRGSHESDREERMACRKHWMDKDFRAACYFCKGVDSEDIFTVQRK